MFSKKGWRPAICEFLSRLELGDLSKNGVADCIDNWTEELVKVVGLWGPSRKATNLFLRDATYNFMLRTHFGLDKFEAELELPLDGVVMKVLRVLDTSLPPPPSVKALTPCVSKKYQASAVKLAEKECIDRVHLDIALWNGGSGGSKS
jgi:hypothetical protein